MISTAAVILAVTTATALSSGTAVFEPEVILSTAVETHEPELEAFEPEFDESEDEETEAVDPGVEDPESIDLPAPEPLVPEPLEPAPAPVILETPQTFVPMKGLHLTAWVAGTRKLRRAFLAKTSGTVVNAIVVPVKETDGRVYIPGVASAVRFGTQRVAIPRPAELVDDIHERGLVAVARVVVFEDNKLPRKKPEWGIQDVDGGLWENRKKLAWGDPYNRDVWEYNLEIASKAVSYGFDEIQFDYIRFPSDGKTERCRYSRVDHSSATAVANIVAFLDEARRRFETVGVPVSAAVFGLVVSARDDLGIGQDIDDITPVVDAVSPMMYPSHYPRGAYGLKHPNASPYEVIDYGLRDGTRRLGRQAYKLRPYLQDFSLGVRYREDEVRAQIEAAVSRGVHSWILWNPQNRYTWDALVERAPESSITPPGGRRSPPDRQALPQSL